MTEQTDNSNAEHGREVDIKTPLSFKVMVVLASVYLLYRLVQGVVWLFQALSG